MAIKIGKVTDMENSENLYRTTIDSITDMIHVLDADFNFLVLNQAMRDWLKKMNIVPDEIIGKNIFDIFPFLGDRVKDEYRHLFASGVPVSTIETTMINHQEVITETKKSPIFENGSITRVITVISDITKLKHNEKKIKKSEERYKNFISQVTDGVYRYELNKPMPLDRPVEEQIDFLYEHLIIAECNSAFMKMYGAENLEDIIGKSQTDLHGGKDNPVDREAMRSFINSGYRGKNIITEETDADGAVKYFNNNAIGIIENNHLIRMWGTQTDITERLAAEKVVKENEKKQNAMIANISDVSAILDQNALIKYKSPNIEKIFGWKPEDLVNTDGWQTVHPEDLERIQQEFHKLLKTKKGSIKVEYRYKCKNGSYKMIELHATNLINDPIIKGVLLNYHDISERKKVDDSLKINEQRWKQAQSVAKIGNWEFDIAAGTIWGSKEAFSIYGFELNLKENPEQFLPLDKVEKCVTEKDKVHQALIDLMQSNKAYNLEYEIIREIDNEKIIIQSIAEQIYDAKGKPVKISGTIQNITERKQAEEELKKHHDNLEEMVNERTKEIAERNKELESMHKVFVGREFRIKELRDQVKELKERLGEG